MLKPASKTSKRPALLAGLTAGLLLLCVPPLTAETTNTVTLTNLNWAVPDGSGSGMSCSTNLSSPIGSITAARIRLTVAGEFNGDLYAYLRHVTPGGTNLCVLLNRPGRTAGNPSGYADAGLDVTFSSAAVNDVHLYGDYVSLPADVPLTGVWQPDGRKTSPMTVLDTSPRTTDLSGFVGMEGSGEWTLFVADLESGGTNQLAGWELEIQGRAIPPVTWPSPADLVYGTPLGSSELNASSPVAGTFGYFPDSGTILNAGSNQILTAVFTPTDTVNYLPTTNTAQIHVQLAPLTVTAQNAAKLYGEPLPPLTASYNGFVNGDTTSQLTSLATMSTLATDMSPVGNYPVTAGGVVSSNYFVSYQSGQLSIAPAMTSGSVSVSPNPAVPGDPVTLTYALGVIAPGGGIPSGSVEFKLDGSSLGTATLSGGEAALSTSALAFGSHTLVAEYAGDGNLLGTTNQLGAALVINTPPTAVADSFIRYQTGGVKFSITHLLSNDLESDPTDSLRLASLAGTSTLGGTVVSNGNWIEYTPPAGNTNTDTFTYTIEDTLGASSLATVTILYSPDMAPSMALQIIDLQNGNFLIHFDGIPDSTYDLETSPTVGAPSWNYWMTTNSDANGIIVVTDSVTNGAPDKFYRTVYR